MIKVVFYAQLKDFFGEETELELPVNPVAAGIRSALAAKNSLADEWLRVSRLASEDAFISEEEQIKDGGRYYLLPPSSGG